MSGSIAAESFNGFGRNTHAHDNMADVMVRVMGICTT